MYTKQLAQIISTVCTGLLLSTSIAWAEDKANEGISPQPLTSALAEFAEQSGLQLVYLTELTEGIETQGADPTQISEEALDQLLADTGLRYEFINDRTVSIEAKLPSTELSPESRKLGKSLPASNLALMAQNQTPALGRQQTRRISSNTTNNSDKDSSRQLEEIVVTGTSIRGVIPESSPLEIYDSVDIQNTGALTIEQFVAKLPQNNNTLSEVGAGTNGREFNSAGANAIDLRGLGVGTTLVLVNGRRLAPSSFGRSPDVSFIPIGLVDRVEVLTDGASAIYGADAVGGVINFVLKDDQEGAQTVLTYGTAGGDLDQFRVDQSFDLDWGGGNAIFAASYFNRTELDASDRDYTDVPGPFTLIPEDRRENLFATVAQRLPGDIELTADLLYSTRDLRTAQTRSDLVDSRFQERDTKSDQFFVNVGLGRDLTDNIGGEFLATWARSTSDIEGQSTIPGDTSIPFFEDRETTNLELTATIGGDLMELQAGTLKFSAGIGYAEDEYNTDRTSTSGFAFTTHQDRETKYAFGELFLPIVSERQDISGMRRLEITLAARYTDVSDYGDNTSPKVGVLWSPVESLNIRGTFGESFRAPFLSQLDSTSGSNLLFPTAAVGVPDIWTADNSTIMLLTLGAGNPNLLAEQAESYTLGFDFDPPVLDGLRVSATYFNIDYSDRIAEPDPSGGFVLVFNPLDFPDQFIVDPSLALISEILDFTVNVGNFTAVDIMDPAAVTVATTVVADGRLANIASSQIDGLDISIDFIRDTAIGDLNVGLNMSRIFDYFDQVTQTSPEATRVDTLLFPADLKGRVYVGFSDSAWSAVLNINYVDEYENPFNSANPVIDDWTTLDLQLSYNFGERSNRLLDGWQLGLTVQNLLDEDPPFVALADVTNQGLTIPVGFDANNANPLGRFVNVQLVKLW